LALLATANLNAAPKLTSKKNAKPKALAQSQPDTPKATGPTSSGAEPYTPTKCDWMAVELNSNYRVASPKDGYSLQIFCRPPNTIFLSYRYLTEADQNAAQENDDAVRAMVGQLARARGWKWVQVDDELVKAESSAAKAPEKKPLAKEIKKPKSNIEETDTMEEVKPVEGQAGEASAEGELPPPTESVAPESE
jgi:hypothetical protein